MKSRTIGADGVLNKEREGVFNYGCLSVDC